MKPETFPETKIAQLFGHEAAEDETPAKLRQYYFKNQAYDQVTAELPIRILVGHKGIGKSALFQIALQEDREAQKLAIELRPDDVLPVHTAGLSFNAQIAAWKAGLKEIIRDKALEALSIDRQDLKSSAKVATGIISWLSQTLQPLVENYVDLDPTKAAISKRFLAERRVTVYMDDLDRGWQGQGDDISRISALLNAVRDLSRENLGVWFRIALRADVYFLVRTSDESTDKLGSSVVWFKWTNHEILALLVKRLLSHRGKATDEAALLRRSQPELSLDLPPTISSRYDGEGKWQNAPMYRIIMSLIRRRPRDLVKLLTLAARKANDDRSETIETHHFRAVFDEYSQDRLQDTINEYRSELPDIQRLLLGMKPNRRERETRGEYLYALPELLQKINNIIQSGVFKDAKQRVVSTKELAAFLYKINFLIASKTEATGFIQRKYFEEHRYIAPDIADFGYSWEVHPAYRWALQPDDKFAIFDKLGLSED